MNCLSPLLGVKKAHDRSEETQVIPLVQSGVRQSGRINICNIWPAAVATHIVKLASRCHSLCLATVLVSPLVTAGCGGGGLAGIPSAAQSGTSAPAVVRDVPSGELAQWDLRWRAIQVRPESTSLADHWRVCEIKFRFRIYRDLFRCLDLIEARSDKDARELRFAPVIVGWMRTEAYAELGEPVEALKRGEAAWAALPKNYRDGTAVFDAGANPVRRFVPIVGAIIGAAIFHDDFE